MTPEQLAEIETRANAATSGPWNTDGPCWWEGNDCTDVVTAHPNRDSVAVMPRERDCDPAKRHPNAKFIAHARTDVPALIAEVKRLRGLEMFGNEEHAKRLSEIEELQQQIRDAHHDLCLAVGDSYTTVNSAAFEATRQIAMLTAERDRARDAAVALQQQFATEFERAAAEVENLSISDSSGDRANKLVAWLRTRVRRERLALSARGESS